MATRGVLCAAALMAVALAGCGGDGAQHGRGATPDPPAARLGHYYLLVSEGPVDRDPGQTDRERQRFWVSPAHRAYRAEGRLHCTPAPCASPWRWWRAYDGRRTFASFDSYGGKQVRIGPPRFLVNADHMLRGLVRAWLEGRETYLGYPLRITTQAGRPCLDLELPEAAPGCIVVRRRISAAEVRERALLRVDTSRADWFSRMSRPGSGPLGPIRAWWLGPRWNGMRADAAVEGRDEGRSHHTTFYLPRDETRSSNAWPNAAPYADHEVQLRCEPLATARPTIPDGGRPVTLRGGEPARLVDLTMGEGRRFVVVTRDTVIWLNGVAAADALAAARALRPL